MKSSVVLLGLARSVYTRIARLALEEKNVEYVLEETDIFNGGDPPSSYFKRQPFGKIPCLIHDDFCLYETVAITRYVDEMFPGSDLQPAELALRARMSQVISVLDAYAYRPMVWNVFVQRIVVPEEGGQPDERIIFAALPIIDTVLTQLETWLGEDEFFAGCSMTLADLHGFPMLFYFAQTPEGVRLLEPRPRIQRWLNRMKERPSVQKTRSLRG